MAQGLRYFWLLWVCLHGIPSVCYGEVGLIMLYSPVPTHNQTWNAEVKLLGEHPPLAALEI